MKYIWLSWGLTGNIIALIVALCMFAYNSSVPSLVAGMILGFQIVFIWEHTFYHDHIINYNRSIRKYKQTLRKWKRNHAHYKHKHNL